jgi:hypothetical protein
MTETRKNLTLSRARTVTAVLELNEKELNAALDLTVTVTGIALSQGDDRGQSFRRAVLSGRGGH